MKREILDKMPQVDLPAAFWSVFEDGMGAALELCDIRPCIYKVLYRKLIHTNEKAGLFLLLWSIKIIHMIYS